MGNYIIYKQCISSVSRDIVLAIFRLFSSRIYKVAKLFLLILERERVVSRV